MSLQADRQSGLSRYPAGSDVELVAALLHFLEESGWRPEELDERAGLHPGAGAALASGHVEPSGPLLRRLCHVLRVPRWLFHLTGAIVVGAATGNRDLDELVEKRRRQLAGDPDRITDTDLVVEGVEIVLAVGEDLAGGQDSASGSRRGLVDGLKRLARRAERRGAADETAALLSAIAAIVLSRLEEFAVVELRPVIEVLETARSFGDRAEPSAARGLPGRDCGSRKAEIRAVWMRISEHTEALRRIAGELIDLSEGGPSASPNLPGRLAGHVAGVLQATSDLNLLAATIHKRDEGCSARE